MKVFLFLALAVLAVNGLPFGTDPEYAMVPDGSGSFKLVNINENPEPESFFNPAADIIFLLHTTQNPAGEVLRLGDPESIRGSNFDARNPTR